MGFDTWYVLSKAEGTARVPPGDLWIIAVVCFLILAALYESWSLPFSVLADTPVAVFGAFAVLWLRRVG